MKRKDMKLAPKDRPILLLIDSCWIEGSWNTQVTTQGYSYGPGRWEVVSLQSHGCGCCSGDDPEPEAWAEPPT